MKRILFGRRILRIVLVLWAALLLGSAGGPGALAQEQTTSGVSQTGYFTKTQDPTKTAGGQATTATCQIPYNPSLPAGGGYCLNPAGVTGGTPGWPRRDNYVYVTKIRGDEDAFGVMTPDLSAIPFGATLLAISFEFQIENEADVGTVNYDASKPSPLKACLVTSDWAPGDAGAWELRPSFDCGTTAKTTKIKEEVRREPDATGTLRDRRVVTLGADLMPMAEQWAKDRPNFGVAMLTTADSAADFQIAIRTPSDIAKDAMVTRVSFDAPEEDFGFGDLTGGEGTVSFGGFSEAPVPLSTGPFTTAPPQRTEAVAVASNPVTPFWVWTIIPIGLAGLAVLVGVVTGDVALAEERLGPVGRLMQRRATARQGG